MISRSFGYWNCGKCGGRMHSAISQDYSLRTGLCGPCLVKAGRLKNGVLIGTDASPKVEGPVEIVTCSGCGYRMFSGNSTAYQRDTEVCGWCRGRGISGKEAVPKLEAKMGGVRQWCAGCDEQKNFIDDGVGEVQCSACGLWMGRDVPRKEASPKVEAKMGMGIELIDQVSAATPAGHPEFYKIVEEMKALHEKKAKDYGLGKDVLANCRGSEDFGIPGWIGVVMRMNDKMTRLKSFAQKGSLANESIEDSLIDLANYAVLALILYREKTAGAK